MSATPPAARCDIAIVGGGMVGLTLAVALSSLPLSVVVIEPVTPEADQQPSFDSRTTALSNGSRRILTALGIWPRIAGALTPIERIHVSERGAFAFARIEAAELGLEAIGYTIENRVLGAALLERVSETSVQLRMPARVTGVSRGTDAVTLALDDGSTLQARLVVAADGARSAVREAYGIGNTTTDYGQHAVIANVATSRPHGNVAFERFTDEGPLAVLPTIGGRSTLVLALAPEVADAALALDDAAFLTLAQQRFGRRLGTLTAVGKRVRYPLSLTEADRSIDERLVVIGNAAQALHPVAGMGFNLGLRDVATLAEVLADASAEGELDPGAVLPLERYGDWRRRDRRAVIHFTDGLVRLFDSPLPPLRAARRLGLLLFDQLPIAKQALSRLSTGVGKQLPRLSRGRRL